MNYRGINYHYCLGRFQYGIKSFTTEKELLVFIDKMIDNPFKIN